MINFANWIKLLSEFFLYADPQGRNMLIALGKEKKKSKRHFLALLAGLPEIRLIMSPFRVHMIMADCLQVFSDVFFMPGHVGGAQSLTLCHPCGGLASDQAAVKKRSTVESSNLRQFRLLLACSWLPGVSPGVNSDSLHQVNTDTKVH